MTAALYDSSMSHSLHRASAFLFFLLGATILILMILTRHGFMAGTLTPILYSLDLPLLGIGMLYGGTSLYRSLSHEHEYSLGKILLIAIPLAILFCAFTYFDFGLPFVM